MSEDIEQILTRGIQAIVDIIDNSEGVQGLHHNGDIAEWDSLLRGGQFEEWLIDLSEAIEAIS